jgi:hypothetical protein
MNEDKLEVTEAMVEAGLSAAGTLLSCSITDQQRTDAYKAFLQAAINASGLLERIAELEKEVLSLSEGLAYCINNSRPLNKEPTS